MHVANLTCIILTTRPKRALRDPVNHNDDKPRTAVGRLHRPARDGSGPILPSHGLRPEQVANSCSSTSIWAAPFTAPNCGRWAPPLPRTRIPSCRRSMQPPAGRKSRKSQRSRSPNALSENWVYHFDDAPKADFEDQQIKMTTPRGLQRGGFMGRTR